MKKVVNFKNRKNIDDYKQENSPLNNPSFITENNITNIKLEHEVWATLHFISCFEKIELNVLLGHINFRKQYKVSLETACRVFVLSYIFKADEIEKKKLQEFYIQYKKEKSI